MNEVTGLERSVLIDDVNDWLMLQALGDAQIEEIFDGCCQRLDGAGISISRAMVTFRTLHPLYASMYLFWRRGEEVRTQKTHHADAFTGEQFKRSPIAYMMAAGTPFLRRTLGGENVQLDFPILEDLQAQGATDYFAYKVAFSTHLDDTYQSDGIIGSWATNRPGGFSERDIRSLIRVQRRFAVACKMQITREVTQTVLSAYLGRDAGQRVLKGQIRRGDGERINAVIWYSDMRDSTPWAEALEPDDFLKLVNGYFEATAGAVIEEGGDVLRFIGDAVLAIFPLDDQQNQERTAADRACAAIKNATVRMDEMNVKRQAAGDDPIGCGIALHVGEVTFGNIGVPERVEFSVIGAAANEVARLESMTKVLGRRVLVSGEFASLASDVDWESLGEHVLKGVNEPLQVFAPPAGY